MTIFTGYKTMARILKMLGERKKENQRGATAVEFAIVILLFLTIVFGIIEFGLLMYNQHIVTNAGREGARYGIVYRTDGNRIQENQIRNKIGDWNQYIITFGDKHWDVTATPCVISGNFLEVTVVYDYDFLFLPFQRRLSSTTTMRCE